MASDREPPTRRIPAEPPPGGVREREYAEVDDEPLRDRIRSLRTALVLTALLALAALGVGLYALLADDEEDDGQRGASPARVSALEDRVEELESRVENRATEGDLDELQQRQEELAQQVEEAAAGADTEELQQSVDQLSEDLEALEQRVDEVASAAEQAQP